MTPRKNFQELRDRIDADPKRKARVARARDDAIAEQIAYRLAELRQMREVTQVELAKALKTSQPNVSRIEAGEDALLSTVRQYVEGLGGRLELCVVFDEERFPISA